jgi:iron complex outermembrane recepter protein
MATSVPHPRAIPYRLVCLWLALATMAVHAQSPLGLAELSLEELMEIEVSSVSRKSEKLASVAAAVTVITANDMRHAGVTTLPEALRLAQGLHVAHIDANKWAIAARGFNAQFVGYLLVLIDGRSVYSPLFSGVFWEIQDLLLDDVDRIEVIRGPGATMWGANAVNGIINVITRPAVETQGTLVRVAGGTQERGAAVRHGTSVGETGHVRAYVKLDDRGTYVDDAGVAAHDGSSSAHGGFRADWDPAEGTSASLLGGLYKVDADETLSIPVLEPPYDNIVEDRRRYLGGHLLGRWRRAWAGGQELTLQTYYEISEEKGVWTQPDGPLQHRRQTLDFDSQFSLAPRGRHKLMWGTGYRTTRDDIAEMVDFHLVPPRRTDHLLSAFFLDEVDLSENRLHLSVGSKFEHNGYTGFEFQPSLRLLGRLRPNHSLWAAVSRAVRTPTRIEHDVRLIGDVLPPDSPMNPVNVPLRVELQGNRQMRSTQLLAWEVGYRADLPGLAAVDLAGFYHVYDDLRTMEPQSTSYDSLAAIPHLELNFKAQNRMSGEAYGLEAMLEARPSTRWRLRATYSWMEMDLRLAADSRDPRSDELENEMPRHQWALRSNCDLRRNLGLDVNLRYISQLAGLDVDGYAGLDARLQWQVRPEWQLSLVGRSLLQDDHLEFRKEAFINTQSNRVQRDVYLSSTWNFGPKLKH